MTDIKDRLHGGVEYRKKEGADRLKAILSLINRRGVVTESEIILETGLDKKELKKFIEFLKEKRLIDVKKRFMKEDEISIAAGKIIRPKTQQMPEPTQTQTESSTTSVSDQQPESMVEPSVSSDVSESMVEPSTTTTPDSVEVESPLPDEASVVSEPEIPSYSSDLLKQQEKVGGEEIGSAAAKVDWKSDAELKTQKEPDITASTTDTDQLSESTGIDYSSTTDIPDYSSVSDTSKEKELKLDEEFGIGDVLKPGEEDIAATSKPAMQPSLEFEPSLEETYKPTLDEPGSETQTPLESKAEGELDYDSISSVDSGPPADLDLEPNPSKTQIDKPKAAESASMQESMQVKPQEQSGEMMLSGERVVPETEEEFKEVCRSLTTDFVGVMRLSGEIEDESYTAGLLIDKGNLIATSFEHMNTVEVSYGDMAMHEIQTRFAGTKGDLEIFEMTEEDLDRSLQTNVDYLLSKPMKLSALRIKIKSRKRPEPPSEDKKGVLAGIKSVFSKSEAQDKQERRRMLREKSVKKIGGGVNLVDFARNLKMDPNKAKRFEELRKKRKAMGPVINKEVDAKKAARLEQLKIKKSASVKGLVSGAMPGASKQERIDQIRRMRESPTIALEKGEKQPIKRVKEGKKIKTSIDSLYELVKEHRRLKINDALAAKLKVSKTQIEEWSMILEEHNLLELRYPTIGEPEILSVEPNQKVSEEQSDDKEKKR